MIQMIHASIVIAK